MTLGGYEIPIGTKVIRWGMISSNSSENFSNPEMFLPERWLRENSLYKKTSPFANLPFGHGPRYKYDSPIVLLTIDVHRAGLVLDRGLQSLRCRW